MRISCVISYLCSSDLISSQNYDYLKDLYIKGKVVMLINEGETIDKTGKSIITKTESLSDWSTKQNKRIQYILGKEPALILAVSPKVSDRLSNYKDYFSNSRMMLKETYKETDQDHVIAHITQKTADLFFQGSKRITKSLKLGSTRKKNLIQ